MRVILAANERIGFNCLKLLLDAKAEIVGVITDKNTDKLQLRNRQIIQLAQHNNLPLFQPQNINEPDFIAQIKTLNPDIILNVVFFQIYKNEFLKIPKLGCINFHPGALPQYCGMFPWIWAIINGEKECGVTIHFMTEKVDAGDIISSRKFPITPEDTGVSLLQKCYAEGTKLFEDTVPKILSGKFDAVPQDMDLRKYYPMKIPNNAEIDFTWSAERIVNFVRALTFSPFPSPLAPPSIKIEDVKLIIRKADTKQGDSTEKVKPGQIIDIHKDGFVMQTGLGQVNFNISEESKNELDKLLVIN